MILDRKAVESAPRVRCRWYLGVLFHVDGNFNVFEYVVLGPFFKLGWEGAVRVYGKIAEPGRDHDDWAEGFQGFQRVWSE